MRNSLRLHVDADGAVWCGEGEICAYRTDYGPAAFVDRTVVSMAEEIRLLGTPGNALLICLLHARRTSGGCRAPLRLFGPAGLRDQAAPEVLRRLWQPDLPFYAESRPHEFCALEYPMYRLAAEVHAGVPSPIGHLHTHPAWPAADFLGCVGGQELSQLLGEIVDPRWFTDPRRPDRFNRLWAWLGLGGWNRGADRARRAVLVRSAWCRGEGPDNQILRRVLGRTPWDEGDRRRVDRFVLRFVCRAWLQHLHPRRNLFQPERLLKQEDELQDWKTRSEAV